MTKRPDITECSNDIINIGGESSFKLTKACTGKTVVHRTESVWRTRVSRHHKAFRHTERPDGIINIGGEISFTLHQQVISYSKESNKEPLKI